MSPEHGDQGTGTACQEPGPQPPTGLPFTLPPLQVPLIAENSRKPAGQGPGEAIHRHTALRPRQTECFKTIQISYLTVREIRRPKPVPKSRCLHNGGSFWSARGKSIFLSLLPSTGCPYSLPCGHTIHPMFPLTYFLLSFLILLQ